MLTRTHVHDRARTAQHNTTQGETLRNVVRGLMYMVSGKASGTEALRLLAQVSSRAVGFRVDGFIFLGSGAEALRLFSQISSRV
jgi:hypothetical protein